MWVQVSTKLFTLDVDVDVDESENNVLFLMVNSSM
jgi:hypothetical protein